MNQVKIERPISIDMEVIEKDRYLPSFKTDTRCIIKHPTGSVTYNASDIWFDCGVWDLFIENLSKVNKNQSATLSDLSDCFIISIFSKAGELFFSFKSIEKIGNGNFINIDMQTIIDEDIIAQLKRGVEEIDKWW